MKIESFSGENFVPIDVDTSDPASVADASEIIVDIGDEDIEDEDLEVVEILGSQVLEEKRKKIRKRTGGLLEQIAVEPVSVETSDADTMPPVEEDDLAVYVKSVARSADERKAEDILALRISKLSYIASFIVLITGKNTPQLRAIANLVEENLAKDHELQPRRTDGTANSGWLLLDCTYALRLPRFLFKSTCALPQLLTENYFRAIPSLLSVS